MGTRTLGFLLVTVACAAPAPPPSRLPALRARGGGEESRPTSTASANARAIAARVLATLSLEEKIAQMVIAYPPRRDGAFDLGGVILLGKILRDPEGLRARIADLQKRSRIPLLVAVDLEGGELNRLRAVRTMAAFPSAREMGEEGIWEAEAWGRRAGLDLRALGVNTSLGPVFDVADSGFMAATGRSLGADPTRVARLGRAFARGLRSAGIMAIGKHYPGYGAVGESSDRALLVVDRDVQEIARQQAAFVAAGDQLAGVMLANVGFRAYGSVPAILSPEIVARAHLSGFLTMTDDLAVPSLLAATGGDAGELIRRAFLAGNDVLLTTAPPDWDKGPDPREIVAAQVRSRPELARRVDESVLRILTVKARAGLLEAPRPPLATR